MISRGYEFAISHMKRRQESSIFIERKTALFLTGSASRIFFFPFVHLPGHSPDASAAGFDNDAETAGQPCNQQHENQTDDDGKDFSHGSSLRRWSGRIMPCCAFPRNGRVDARKEMPEHIRTYRSEGVFDAGTA